MVWISHDLVLSESTITHFDPWADLTDFQVIELFGVVEGSMASPTPLGYFKTIRHKTQECVEYVKLPERLQDSVLWPFALKHTIKHTLERRVTMPSGEVVSLTELARRTNMHRPQGRTYGMTTEQFEDWVAEKRVKTAEGMKHFDPDAIMNTRQGPNASKKRGKKKVKMLTIGDFLS